MDDPIDSTSWVLPADVPFLNRTVIEDACAMARKVATALFVIGALGVLGWLWIIVQGIDELLDLDEGEFPESGLVFTEGDASASDYGDLFAHSASYLLTAAIVVALSVLLRLVAAHVGSTAGIDVSEVAVGDPLPDLEDPRDG